MIDLTDIDIPNVDSLSLAEILAELPDDHPIYEAISEMEPADVDRLLYSWQFRGRPSQQWPDWCRDPECGCMGDWALWLVLSGRGWGKSRVGSEWCHEMAWKYPGCRIAIVGPTAGSVRSVQIEGDSGIILTQKPWNQCEFEPTNLIIRWANGSMGHLYSAEESRRLRGPQHHLAWCDELCAWAKPQDVWNMMNLGLRLPRRAGWPEFRTRKVVTTTPIPTPFILELAGKSKPKPKTTHITIGSSYENMRNLAPEFQESLRELDGTRLGRQEIYGDILVDVPGALWKHDMIDPYRIVKEQVPQNLRSTVVAIDPSAGGENSTGIIVCASGPPPGSNLEDVVDEAHPSIAESLRKNQRLHGYVLADLTARKGQRESPDKWARVAARAYHDFGASCIIAESNQGGEMIRYTINTVDSSIPVRLVHATKNKKTRAEPIVALFEQGRVHMVGKHPFLEEQLLTWDPELSASPDRLDAMVWGLHHLLGRGKIHGFAPPQGIRKSGGYSPIISFAA